MKTRLLAAFVSTGFLVASGLALAQATGNAGTGSTDAGATSGTASGMRTEGSTGTTGTTGNTGTTGSSGANMSGADAKASGDASAPTSNTTNTAATASTKDIVDTAAAAGQFNTLQTALTQAGLVDTLKGAGPYTVFAPTDAAFKKIPKKQLDALLADKELLAETLKHHVVSGNVKAADVATMKSAEPLAGGPIAVKVTGKGDKAKVSLGKGRVTQADIAASNGVIHVIDTVLIPADAAKKLR